MSSVLPINTQRYQSGDYTLEVTAHVSPLSQWSDRTVIRQLRFSLWRAQPERQRLATGNQQQLMALSQQIETYVQLHLTQQSWPVSHRLTLLDQELTVSTMQLFDLAEVFNTYGHTHITLPAVPKRQRSRWWAGSAAASLLVAVGVTAVYLQSRPAAWNEVATTQAPNVAADEAATAEPPEIAPIAETGQPAELPTANIPVTELENRSSEPGLREELPVSRSAELPSQDSLEAAPPPDPLEESMMEQSPEADVLPGPPAAPPAASDGTDIASTEAPPSVAEELEDMAETDHAGSLRHHSAEPEAATIQRSESEHRTVDSRAVLAAIAAELATYQPAEKLYPLAYHLQIEADGTITTIEPISESAPAISLPDLVIAPAPGRPLKVEVTYTGASQPLVRELPE